MFTYATVVTEWILKLREHHQAHACLASVWITVHHEKMHAFLNAWVEDSITAGLGTVNSKLKKKVRKSLNPFLLSLQIMRTNNIYEYCAYLLFSRLHKFYVGGSLCETKRLIGGLQLCRCTVWSQKLQHKVFVSLYPHFHHYFLKSYWRAVKLVRRIWFSQRVTVEISSVILPNYMQLTHPYYKEGCWK